MPRLARRFADAPLITYGPAVALPDFAARVERLRCWPASIASGYMITKGSTTDQISRLCV